MIRTHGGGVGRIDSGRHRRPFKAPAGAAQRGGGSAGEACLTRAFFGRETPVELDLLQVEKVH